MFINIDDEMWFDIAIIPVTDEPMEVVAFDVQDHTRRTGTILDRYTWGDDQFEPLLWT